MRGLRGQRVLVTRARHQAEELATALRNLGAEVILLPLIEIGPPVDLPALERAAASVNSFDWLIFTSANAVEAFTAVLPSSPSTVSAKVAAIGTTTAGKARERGFAVACIPKTSTSEGLAASFGEDDLKRKRVLVPSSALSGDVLRQELTARGALVQVVEAYRNVMAPEAPDLVGKVFRDAPDWITFASPSAVENLLQLVDSAVVQRCKLASIGPSTSKELRKHGLEPSVEASPHTIVAMVAAMALANQNLHARL
jgi:uroporphyrinogen III methyltransferase/synthase